MERMGKKFGFMSKEDGNIREAYTNNGLMWFIDELLPKEDGSFEETERAIPWEALIQKYSPCGDEARAFLKSCISRILDTYREKISETERILAEM